jgi:hypothetical protein
VRALGAVTSTLLLLLLVMPLTGAQAGGSVGNVAPTVVSLASQPAVITATSKLYGDVRDGNGEADMLVLRLARSVPTATWSNHTVSATDLQDTSMPAVATAGWRVWNPVPGDGRLSWAFDWTPTQTGKHTWNLTVADEALQASRWINVTVGSPGSGGSGGSGGGNPPPSGSSTSSPTEETSQSETGTTESDSGQGPVGDSPGIPPVSQPRDLSVTLRLSTDGVNVFLDWDPVDGALGYQVWRHMSPWSLRAEVEAQTHYAEPLPDRDASYKVTFFTNRTAAGGWAPDGAHAQAIKGWDDSSFAAFDAGPVPGPRVPAWTGWALLGAAVLVGGSLAAVFFVRRPAKPPR